MTPFDLAAPYPEILTFPHRMASEAWNGIRLRGYYEPELLTYHGLRFFEDGYPEPLRIASMRGNFVRAYFPDYDRYFEWRGLWSELRELLHSIELATEITFEVGTCIEIGVTVLALTGVGAPIAVALAVPLAAIAAVTEYAGGINAVASFCIGEVNGVIAEIDAQVSAAADLVSSMVPDGEISLYDGNPIPSIQVRLESMISTLTAPGVDLAGKWPETRISEASSGDDPDARAALWMLLRIAQCHLMLGVNRALRNILEFDSETIA